MDNYLARLLSTLAQEKRSEEIQAAYETNSETDHEYQEMISKMNAESEMIEMLRDVRGR